MQYFEFLALKMSYAKIVNVTDQWTDRLTNRQTFKGTFIYYVINKKGRGSKMLLFDDIVRGGC